MEEQSSSMIKQNSISKLHTLAYNMHEFSQSRRSVASINDLHTISKDNEKLDNKVANKMRKLFLKGIDPLTMQPFSQAQEKYEQIKSRRIKNKIRVPKIQFNNSSILQDDTSQQKVLNIENKRNTNSIVMEIDPITSSHILKESRNPSNINLIRRASILSSVKLPIIGRSNSQIRLSKGLISQTRIDRQDYKNKSQAALSNSNSQTLINNNLRKDLITELSLFESEFDPKIAALPKNISVKGRESKFRK